LVNGQRCSIAVQFVSKSEVYQGAGIKLLAVARIRVQQPLPIYLVCRSESKNRDKQLTFIDRVSFSGMFILRF